MANRVTDMERKRDRGRRLVGYHCQLKEDQSVQVWVSQDELELEFHGLDLKKVCRLAAERASAKDIENGEVVASRALLIEVEEKEMSGGRG